MTAEYEAYLDDAARQLMEKITFEQIVEALSHYHDTDNKQELLSRAVNICDYNMAGAALFSICYEYYRNLEDYKRSNDIVNTASPFGEEYGPRT